jgi:hypothetical protein
MNVIFKDSNTNEKEDYVNDMNILNEILDFNKEDSKENKKKTKETDEVIHFKDKIDGKNELNCLFDERKKIGKKNKNSVSQKKKEINDNNNSSVIVEPFPSSKITSMELGASFHNVKCGYIYIY